MPLTHAKVRSVVNGKVAELVEGTTLLTWQGLIALAGSNPALSALFLSQIKPSCAFLRVVYPRGVVN